MSKSPQVSAREAAAEFSAEFRSDPENEKLYQESQRRMTAPRTPTQLADELEQHLHGLTGGSIWLSVVGAQEIVAALRHEPSASDAALEAFWEGVGFVNQDDLPDDEQVRRGIEAALAAMREGELE
jgi:hypothetical protein